MPAAREAVSRRPECPGRSSSGSTISGPQAGRPWSASSHPEEARHSEARTILAPGSARNLLQSPEGGRNRYFKIDFPLFGDGYPKKGRARGRDASSSSQESGMAIRISRHVFCPPARPGGVVWWGRLRPAAVGSSRSAARFTDRCAECALRQAPEPLGPPARWTWGPCPP